MLPDAARTILESEDAAAFFSDRDGALVAWTPWAEELLGYAADEIVGRRVDVLIPPQYHDLHWAGYGRAIENGAFRNPDGATLPVVAKDGSQIPLAFEGRIVHADGRVAGIVSLLRRA